MHFIKDVEYIKEYQLGLVFEDDNYRIVNLENYLEGEIFTPLKDLNYFKQVYVNPDIDTICWNNGADLAPEFLYEISQPMNN